MSEGEATGSGASEKYPSDRTGTVPVPKYVEALKQFAPATQHEELDRIVSKYESGKLRAPAVRTPCPSSVRTAGASRGSGRRHILRALHTGVRELFIYYLLLLN